MDSVRNGYSWTNVSKNMGHPSSVDCTDKPNMSTHSTYLKTFMLDNSSDEETSSPPPAKPRSSFFYQESIPTSDIFPRHPAKRKRTSSNSSHSDVEVRPPLRQYSRNSSARSSRNNSEKCTKSGTVCGTYGSATDKPCYRPKFPSDESDDFTYSRSIGTAEYHNFLRYECQMSIMKSLNSIENTNQTVNS